MDLKNLIKKNDPEPIMKLLFLVQGLAYFTLICGITGFFGWLLFLGSNLFIAGEFLGMSLICALIFIWILNTIVSMVPPEIIEDLKEQIREELEQKKEEKLNNKKKK